MKACWWAIAWIAIVLIYVRVFEATLGAVFIIGVITGGCLAGFVQGINSVRGGE